MRTPSDLPNTDSANTDYPHGRLRNDLIAGDGSGTPIRADWQSDLVYGHLEVLDRAGIVPNHAAETATTNQFADAIETIIDDHIDANIVDNLHLADMPTMTIKGNDTALPTDPQDLTVSEVKTMLALENVTNESKATMFTNPAFTGIPTAPSAAAATDTTQVATTEFVHDAIAADTDYLADFRTWDSTRTYSLNDPVFYNGVPYKSLQNSNTNQNPATAPTYWELVAPTAGTVATITGDYTLLATDYLVLVNTANAVQITMPAGLSIGKQIAIQRIVGGTTNAITLVRSGAETIEGATSFVFPPSASYTLFGVRKVTSTVWTVSVAEVPPVVRAEYTGSTAIVPPNGTAVINFATKVEDTHNAVINPASDFTFVVPVKGLYTVNFIGSNASVAGNASVSMKFYLSTPSDLIVHAVDKASGYGMETSYFTGPHRWPAGTNVKLKWGCNGSTVGNLTSYRVIITRIGD